MIISLKNKLSKQLYHLFQLNGLDPVIDGDSDVFFSFGKKSTQVLYKQIAEEKFKFFSKLPATEFLARKNSLWMSMVNAFGRQVTLEVLPKTYVTSSVGDRKRLESAVNCNGNEQYIVKGRKQKREGLKIVHSKEALKYFDDNDYIVIQEITPCSKLLDNQVFHIRIYFLLDYSNDVLKTYIVEQGKIIYSSNENEIITDNKIEPPSHLPIFTDDFFTFQNVVKENDFWTTITNYTNALTESIKDRIFSTEHSPDQKFTQLMGVDIILDENNKPKILECNAGPELLPKSPKDKELKEGVFHDWMKSFLLNQEPAKLDWTLCGEWNKES